MFVKHKEHLRSPYYEIQNFREIKSEMSDFKPASSISHLMLTGAAGWALKTLPTEYHLVFGSFSLLAVNGFIGVVHFTSSDTNKIIRVLHEQISVTAESMTLPLLNAQLYMAAKYSDSIAWAHIVTAMLPVIGFNILEDNSIVVNSIMVANLMSLCYFRANNSNTSWCGCLIIMTFLNKFVFEKMAWKYDVPSCDVAALGYCFHTILALGCLEDLI